MLDEPMPDATPPDDSLALSPASLAKCLSVEIWLNVAVLLALAVVWGALAADRPTAHYDVADPRTQRLAELEDAFARDRGSRALALRLSETYLELDRPGLAVAALRSADPRVLDDPMLTHRLAQAYEASGRILDAFATADLALTRCARSLGASSVAATTPMPRVRCTEMGYATLDMHRTALEHLVRWGVSEPSQDARVQVAYDLAFRRARVASQ